VPLPLVAPLPPVALLPQAAPLPVVVPQLAAMSRRGRCVINLAWPGGLPTVRA
jgi:hypothetical protein